MIVVAKKGGRIAVTKVYTDEVIIGNAVAVDHDTSKITISHDAMEVSTVDLVGYVLLVFAGGLAKATNNHTDIWTVKQ